MTVFAIQDTIQAISREHSGDLRAAILMHSRVTSDPETQSLRGNSEFLTFDISRS
jgi:hypothetical protein